MEDLKPCPFCGGEAHKTSRSARITRNMLSVIECLCCGASAISNRHDGGAELAWNARENDNRIAELEVQLKKQAKLERDMYAYRAALGYEMPAEHDGRLTSGVIPSCGLCDAMRQQIEKLEAQLPRWIPVSEKLPDEEEEIIFRNENKFKYYGKFTVNKRGEQYFMWHTGHILSPHEVLDWMPLTVLPE